MVTREWNEALPTEGSPVPPSGAKRTPASFRVSIAVLTGLLLLWISFFVADGAFSAGPNGKGFGGDFAMFLAGAQVLDSGGNPFDHTALYRVERRTLERQGLPILARAPLIRVGNPPLFFWALRPLTHLPFQPVALGWTLSMLLLSAVGFLAAARAVGLPWRVLPLCLFLLMPQTVTAAFYGNVVGMELAAVGCALLLLKRYPVTAGAVLTFAWLKPQVGLPIVMLVVLFHAPSRTRVLGGFLAGTVCMLVLTALLVSPDPIAWWVHGMTGYSGDMSLQPSLACLSGLYVRWAHAPLRLTLEILGLAGACSLTAVRWMRRSRESRTPIADLAWLWCVWFVASPYAHFPDEILLAVPLVASFARAHATGAYRWPALALYLLFLSLPLATWYPMQANLLALAVLGVALCLAQVRRSESRRLDVSSVRAA